VVSTVLSRDTQNHWNQLGGHINPFNPALQDWLTSTGHTLSDPLTAQILAQELERQASMQAFVDTFWLVTASFLVLAPLLLFFGKQKKTRVQAGESAQPS